MFARRFSVHLKPNKLAEFTKTVDNEIIPLLRKQPGFSDEITFATPDGVEVLAISLWDTQKNAETYAAGAYKDVLKKLDSIIAGTPEIVATEVLNSTLRAVPAAVTAA